MAQRAIGKTSLVTQFTQFTGFISSPTVLITQFTTKNEFAASVARLEGSPEALLQGGVVVARGVVDLGLEQQQAQQLDPFEHIARVRRHPRGRGCLGLAARVGGVLRPRNVALVRHTTHAETQGKSRSRRGVARNSARGGFSLQVKPS